LVSRALVALALLALSACSYLPGRREMERTQEILGTVDAVAEVHFSCGGTLLASDRLCTEVVMKDGVRLRFERVGFNSFGSTAVNVVVAEAGGLVPRVAGCQGVSAANFHRESALGHHFQPTLIDMKDAVFRYREVLEEVQFWPQCPQYWEVQDKAGENFRYCSRKKDATEEPPRPQDCP
jgi:hypothetical protein